MVFPGLDYMDEETYNTVDTKAIIPPCMVQEDKDACLLKTAKPITKELGPVVKDRRCQASDKIKGEQCYMTMIST